ncbi:gamma-glutamyltranspeptidase/glutathione hydrolase [Brevibacterium sanguinis]|uniref:Gamma-glutamyltranspeptidase/glutathione hydrolase n=3 Tax=Brevibacteriaceae TaxID=85019 RepID=A0A366IK11_9MICO|nr:gamma-glutamyltranspeptidase/glutathione hydrolase [Brevibacterium sanguinis]RBP71265.1 gamma-glutamyltranspeptidase/glutathione hydrolase [Brevibacterium celere]
MSAPPPGFTPPAEFTTRPTLRGHFGMAASTHWLATASAQSVLERGGNAFDAAVAGAFVLHVVEPHLNGPGGDMTGIVATAEDPSRPRVLMGQGPAPSGATIEHYRSEGLDMVPGAGALAAAVPGAVDAWLHLLEQHGTWELADVLEYAIDYADNGHPVLARVVGTIERVSELFTEHWPTSADLWMPEGRIPVPGERVCNHAYAEVLRRLIAAGQRTVGRDGPSAHGASAGTEPGADACDGRTARIRAARREWKSGFVAEAIAEFVRRPHRHSTGGDHAGVIAVADIAGFDAGFEEPVTIVFRGHTIAKIGPWGQGPMLLQALRILDGFDDECLDPSTEIGAHTILEAIKLAMADRDSWYGDGDVDLEWLLGEEYATTRRALITERSSLEFRAGSGRNGAGAPFTPPLVTADVDGEAMLKAGLGEPTVQRNGVNNGDTCHIDVVDKWGNMISATPSGGWLQSSPVIPELGFCLGTRLQMMWLDESSPSALVPGRRPRTTLTPTLISRDGEPVMALGSPGGDQQEQWQLLMILRILVGGHEPQQAIDAPAFHTTSLAGSFWPRTWVPGGAVVEDRLGDGVIDGLIARGHVVTRAGDWELGRLSCVTRDPTTGALGAAANPRGAQGYAAGR